MAGSLEFINQTEVTSGVTTIDVDNVFSADYDVYYCQIVGLYHNVNVSNGVEGIRLIDSGGSVISASEYDNATLVLKADTTFQEVRNTSNSYMNMYLITDQQSDGSSSSSFYIYNPYDSSSYTFMQYQSSAGVEDCSISRPGRSDTELIDSCLTDCELALSTPGEVGAYDPFVQQGSNTSIELENERQASLWMECVEEQSCPRLSEGYCAPVK